MCRGGTEVRDCHLVALTRSAALAAHLRALDVSGCSRVTATGVEAVAAVCARCVVIKHLAEHHRVPCPLDPTQCVPNCYIASSCTHTRKLLDCPTSSSEKGTYGRRWS